MKVLNYRNLEDIEAKRDYRTARKLLIYLSRNISKPARNLLIDYLKERLNRNVKGGARGESIEALQKLQC